MDEILFQMYKVECSADLLSMKEKAFTLKYCIILTTIEHEIQFTCWATVLLSVAICLCLR